MQYYIVYFCNTNYKREFFSESDKRRFKKCCNYCSCRSWKTTLVDGLLKQSGIFRDNEHVNDRIMDSVTLKEKGHYNPF